MMMLTAASSTSRPTPSALLAFSPSCAPVPPFFMLFPLLSSASCFPSPALTLCWRSRPSSPSIAYPSSAPIILLSSSFPLPLLSLPPPMPLTPPPTGPDNEPLGLLLAARACGDWSRALHTWAIAPADDWYDDDTYPTKKAVVADATESKRDDGDAAHAIHEQDRIVPTRAVPAQAQRQRAPPGREAHPILEGRTAGLRCTRATMRVCCSLRAGAGRPSRSGCWMSWWGIRRCRSAQEARRHNKLVRALSAADRHACRLARSPIKLSIRIYVICLCDPEARPRVDVIFTGFLGGGAADEEDDEDGAKGKSEMFDLINAESWDR
ncbi:hypothetical protein DFH09DRAFT_1316656 [Mycena vulgaris]|nr:hypothetical protein DFH09DRAFT_1316656 [Mycena vulgaris]